MNKYHLVACGGTFDLFHKGHKTFIEGILKQSERIVLGLTSDLYAKSFKNKDDVGKFEVRKKELEQFLDSIHAKDRIKILEINDIYGPLLTESFKPQAIFVTSQTKKAALEINKKRKERKLPELEIIVFPMELSEDGGIISSSRIRNGEINRDGRLYIKSKWLNRNLILPKKLRPELQKAWGQVVNIENIQINAQKIITVGDITTQKFNKNNMNQFLSIVDFMVRRQKKFNSLSELGFAGSEEVLKIKNSPGAITPGLFKIIKRIFQSNDKKRKVILIDGEEDLAVLPVLLTVPLGFSIFYGQPNQGLVRVNVSEENKEKAYELVNSFLIE